VWTATTSARSSAAVPGRRHRGTPASTQGDGRRPQQRARDPSGHPPRRGAATGTGRPMGCRPTTTVGSRGHTTRPHASRRRPPLSAFPTTRRSRTRGRTHTETPARC
jgi:hypothetical protein